jgi:tetratricopeptide (TPR) repeat protein
MPVDFFNPPLPNELARARRAFSTQIEGELALARGETTRAIDQFKKVIELVPPSQLPALSSLTPRLYLVANQALGQVYEKRGEWQATIAAYRAILDHKVLTILVPAASGIWQRANSAVAALRKRIAREDDWQAGIPLQNSPEARRR